ARARDPDLLAGEGAAVQAGQVGGERVAELRNAEVVAVAELAALDGGDGRPADELRGRLVGLSHPELEDVGPAHAFVGELADARGGERLHRWAGGAGREVVRHLRSF